MTRPSLKPALFLTLALAALELDSLAATRAQPPARVAGKRTGHQGAVRPVQTPVQTIEPGRWFHRPFRPGLTRRLPRSWAIGNHDYVSQAEYDDLRDGVMELLHRYPPDRYFFVGLGRDGAPVTAFLQNLGEKHLAVNLPGTSNIGWANAGLTSADHDRYIEAAIPAAILTGERQLVVFDVTSSGKTPALFGPVLDGYLQRHNIKKTSVKLAFSWANVKAPNATYASRLTDWIDTKKWVDFGNYYTGKYEGTWSENGGGDGIAEHQKHSMVPGGNPPSRISPNYKAFRRALRARMEQDVKLDRFLPTVVPAPLLRAAVPVEPPRPWDPTVTIQFGGGEAVGPGPLLTVANRGLAKAKAKAEKARARAAKARAAGEEVEDEAGEPEPETHGYLALGEYGQLRDGAVALMSMHDPRRSFYVGVGRTATPLVALLENLGKDIATYLPADGLHKLAAKASAQALGGGARQAMFDLFDGFLPERALAGQREIVLFQQSDTGASLPFVRDALDDYLQQRGSTAQVRVVALADAAPPTGIAHVDTSRSPALVELTGAKVKAIAPYAYHRPGWSKNAEDVLDASGEAMPRRAAYGRFKQALAVRMRGDALLAGQVSKLFGTR